MIIGAGAVTALLALAACSTGSGSGNRAANTGSKTSGVAKVGTPTHTPPPADITAAAITAAPLGGATNPKTPVVVKVAHGKLTSVVVTNPQGKHVTGGLSADHSTWTSNEDLGYSKTYQVAATAVNAVGVKALKQSAFTTLTPNNMTMPYMQRAGGYALTDGGTYGVGIVPVVHFDEHIPNEAAAERVLNVTTSPHVNGSWYWADDQDVHWRPESYFAAGTKVTISAGVYGVNVGGGLYGQDDVSTSFKIGAKHITIAEDNAPAVDKVRVYFDNTLVKTMNTSMGKHSSTTVNGKFIDFHTMNGTYTVLEHDNPAIMSSASYGLPANAPGGYAPEPIYYSTKISTDGVYLHELDSTVWAQNNGIDTSHGCLNLDESNARWFYTHSQIGDVVEIQHTGGPTIALWQNGDWSVPWSTWLAGSALH
ncbi:MAG: Ig-like domain-containing protein [Jatrophihabitantaceae bacterium]